MTRRSSRAISKVAAAAIVVILVAGVAAYMLMGGGGEQGAAGPVQTTTTRPALKVEELVIGAVGSTFTLDPAVAADYPSWEVLSLIMEPLVKVNPRTGGIEPGLAVKWETTDNGVTWIFILRDDAKFADGTPVTADAVVKSVQRAQIQQSPYNWLVTAFVSLVQAVNDTAVQFTLKFPVANFPRIVATPPYLVVHPDYPLFEAAPQSTAGGAGPYKIDSFTGREIVLVPNENYYGPEPSVKKITIKLYKTNDALAEALRNGTVDVAWWGLGPLDLEFLQQEGFTIKTSDPLIVKLLSIRVSQGKPTGDVRVRQAIALALSQEEIAQRIVGNLHQPLYSVVPSYLLGYTEAFKNYSKADPEAARQLLEEAGYNELNKLDLKVIYSSKLHGGIDLEIASAIKDQLHETGAVRVDLVDLPPDEYYQAILTGDFDLAIVTLYPVYVDASYYIMATLYSKANRYTGSAYSNPQIDQSILSLLATTDYTVRESAYTLIQETFLVNDIPFIPLVETRLGIAYNQDAEGIILLPNLLLAIP